jgi:hypothetical protein
MIPSRTQIGRPPRSRSPVLDRCDDGHRPTRQLARPTPEFKKNPSRAIAGGHPSTHYGTISTHKANFRSKAQDLMVTSRCRTARA